MGIFRRHILPWSLAFFVLGFVLLYEVPSFPQLPYLVDAGVQRVILGTRACASPEEMARLVRQYCLGTLVPECEEESIAHIINSLDRARIDEMKKTTKE